MLEKVIDIWRINSIYYREFSNTYVFKGECHNFWEFLYVDKGEIDIIAGEKGYRLKQGDMIFHKPNEFHAIYTTGNVAPNAIVMSFETNSAAMTFFENKIIQLNDENKYMIGQIIREAKQYYEDLGLLYVLPEDYKEDMFGSMQLMYAALEYLLIQIYRQNVQGVNKIRSSFFVKEKIEMDLVKAVIEYMEENIYNRIRFEDIYKKFYVSKTKLKVLFKRETGVSIMWYFNQLKMEESKRLIREENYNFTEISNLLRFDSIHYFSTSFRKYYGMTPTEYLTSVKAISEG